MAASIEEYLSMSRKTRLDLAFSIDIHRNNASAQFESFLFSKKKEPLTREMMYKQMEGGTFDLNKDNYPFLRKCVNRKLLNEEWIATHVASLTYIMLWDILSETQPTIRDLYTLKIDGIKDGFKIDERETRRFINEYYQYVVGHPKKWSEKWEKLADDPKYIVWSFGGPRLKRPLPSDKKSTKAIGTPLTIGKALNPEIHLEDYADPYYLERLFTFRKIVLKMLETINQQTKIRKEFHWLIDELAHGDFALTLLFQNATREVERRWFLQLSDNSRAELIFFGREGFTESDISTSILKYKQLYDCPVNKAEFFPFHILPTKIASNSLEQITLAALDFGNRGLMDVPKWLLSNFLKIFNPEAKDKATMEHNLGIFEMLNKEYQAAANHFQSALKFWEFEGFEGSTLHKRIDEWNLAMAIERMGKSTFAETKKHLLDVLEKDTIPTALRIFLICQFAEFSDIFGEKIASKYWFGKGLIDLSILEDLSETALYFESRIGSTEILGDKDERSKILEKMQTFREKYCTILGETEDFIVVFERKFYLLRQGLLETKE
jgi:hypothetical protein